MCARRPSPRVLNWWHKWESPHAHGRRLWSMIKHRCLAHAIYSLHESSRRMCPMCCLDAPQREEATAI